MRSRAQMRWLGLALMLGVVSGCTTTAEAVEKWGPFRGQIVDVETGEPIAGAVVLAIWIELVDALVQTNTQFYDAREAVTGPDGRFEISRRKPPFFTFRILEPEFKVFAPGYAEDRWVVTPPTGQALVDPTVIEMHRLKTGEELRQKSRGYPSYVPEERIPEFIRAINAERAMLGLKPTGKIETPPK
ncbi:MAG: carboxypeptidase-like regulatory domain-containing protein [candidate division NC10 bacterium]|nr:carboxypeptidase-like regulatory domain-containing protein [candidate division NC10 bacterium]